MVCNVVNKKIIYFIQEPFMYIENPLKLSLNPSPTNRGTFKILLFLFIQEKVLRIS